MRITAARLLPAEHCCYYLHGEDQDALVEAAEALLAEGSKDVTRLRVDVSELARIEEACRNRGLFGPSECYALVRNAQSANVKQTEHLLQMSRSVMAGNRLIICAPGIEWRKALHKKMQAERALAQCEFSLPDAASFSRWLTGEIQKSGLLLAPESIAWLAERLYGMRQVARQLIERLLCYDGGEGALISLDVVGDLLGERAPGAIEAWCHAVAMRDAHAINLVCHLLAEKQVAEVQMIYWLGTRVQQLLMFCWYQSQRDRNPLQTAKIFGDARKKVSEEARCWRGAELSLAIARIAEAEQLIKGASLEDNGVVMERLTLDLVAKERLGV
ncbi:MAG: DNA polymerase III subunit delta [Mariprofundus sp.]|nr:DNA polymerase III subunit delta [Mariprofundus sp.]